MASVRKLYLDIETYGETDLPSCGVYRYVEGNAFDILLFGYAWDDDPVEVVDLTAAPFPEELKFALYDDSIIKVASGHAYLPTSAGR